MTPRPLPRIAPRLLAPALAALALALLAVGAAEHLVQQREDEYVGAAAREAVAGARDFDSKVVALRDYVRDRVRNVDFPARGRPFLRDTAAETLRAGRGRCGEATRVFVNMARAAGIPAQRLYLEGRSAHVVAAVETADGRTLVVDAANRFYIPEVETLEGLARRGEFETYSTFGWRRLRPLRALPSNFVRLGPLGRLFENPHALVSWLCILSAAASLALAALVRLRLPRRAAASAPRAGLVAPGALEGEGAEA